MKHLTIPETAAAYQADLMQRAFPDEQITQNDFYRRMIGWVVDNRTPLLYEQTHEGEYANFSINFNWLLLRDYSQTTLGPEQTISTLYALHEASHMTEWLPTRLGELPADQYAEQFTSSEYRASNESEILAHYRVPGLRSVAFSGMRLAVDLMKERGIAQPPSQQLAQVRALLVESDTYDHLAGTDPEAQAELARIKQFNGNRRWARRHFADIQQRFTDPSLPLGYGLTNDTYESTIAAYEPQLTQARYEANVIRNVRFAYGMCSQPLPRIANFEGALAAAAALEGQHALV